MLTTDIAARFYEVTKEDRALRSEKTVRLIVNDRIVRFENLLNKQNDKTFYPLNKKGDPSPIFHLDNIFCNINLFATYKKRDKKKHHLLDAIRLDPLRHYKIDIQEKAVFFIAK